MRSSVYTFVYTLTYEKENCMQIVKLRKVGNSTTVTLPASVVEALHLHENDEIVVEVAAAYGFHLCQNHPILDGNKRTAGMVMFTFLQLNGLEPGASEPDYYAVMISIASGQMSKEQLANWLLEIVS